MPAILDSFIYQPVNTTRTSIGVVGGGHWVAMKWRRASIQKAKMVLIRVFWGPHVTKCIYINAQSHQSVLWWFPASCLGQVKWSHLKITRAPVDVRQAQKWSLSKSRLLNLWQWCTHELLVCCIYQMAVKSETWNYVCIRPLLAYIYIYMHASFALS